MITLMNNVFRVKPDGEGSVPVLVTHNMGLVSMSFDWLSKQLYYVDNIRNSLEVIKISEEVSCCLSDVKIIFWKRRKMK